MKINMYGGALTISYSLAKFLRRKGQDVTLFIDKELYNKSYAPSWEDEELRASYPGWIKIVDVRFGKALCGDKLSRRFASSLADCDILHLHGDAYLWANLTGKPFLWQSHGYDLDQMPFKKANLRELALSFLARRAIRKAAKVIAIPHQHVFLERLGIAEKGLYLPFPLDLDKYNMVESKELRQKILSAHGAELIFFHPSRHEWVNNPATNNKANDKVLRAFASYTRAARGKAVLLLVNKGRNVAESRRLIDLLGIRERVMWLEPMPKSQLISHYSISDIVLDQFNLGSFGQIFLEAMACSRPTLAYIKGYELIYPEAPPAVNVFTDDDIAKSLLELSGDSSKREEIGRRSRAWMQKYHAWEHACDGFISLYETFMKEHTGC